MTMGGYQRLAQLAQGGMCETWLSVPTALDGPSVVVLKQLLPALRESRAAARALKAEAAILEGLTHPNIVRCYGTTGEGADAALVLEYVHGDALHSIQAQCLSRGARLPESMVADLLRQFTSALALVHSQTHDGSALTHSDISPQNMMVDYHGRARLIDFGVSNRARGRGQLVAKPSYASPEQMLGLFHGAPSDMYALGIVAWELLAGRRLFVDSNPITAAQAIIANEIPDIRELRPNVHPTLAELVSRLLAPRPEERWTAAQTFVQLNDLLEAHHDPREIEATASAFLLRYAPQREQLLEAQIARLPSPRAYSPHPPLQEATPEPQNRVTLQHLDALS